jgi:hypothetical protein
MSGLVSEPVQVKVDSTNIISVFELAVNQVTPDETARASDQDIHV